MNHPRLVWSEKGQQLFAIGILVRARPFVRITVDLGLLQIVWSPSGNYTSLQNRWKRAYETLRDGARWASDLDDLEALLLAAQQIADGQEVKSEII